MPVNLIFYSRRGVTLLLLLNSTLYSTLLLKNLKISHFLLLLHISGFGLQISASLFADPYRFTFKSNLLQFLWLCKALPITWEKLAEAQRTYHFPIGFHPVSHSDVFPVPFLMMLVVGRSVFMAVMYSLSASLLVSFLWVLWDCKYSGQVGSLFHLSVVSETPGASVIICWWCKEGILRP